MIYFSQNTVNNLFVKNKKGVQVINNDNCIKLFNSLTNTAIVTKIFKYFLYNEDPEIGDLLQIHYFETPQLIPNILTQIHDKNKDYLYIYIYDKIMKKLNSQKYEDFLTKYPPMVFNSIAAIPPEYPIYILSEIFLFDNGN